jgi:hypothetical protein
VPEAADGDQHDGDIRVAGNGDDASEIIRNAPVTELATTEFTRGAAEQRVYRRVR